MDEQGSDAEEEGEMDVSEAAAGLVQAALNIAAPQVLLPGDVNEVPEHLSRVKLGKGHNSVHNEGGKLPLLVILPAYISVLHLFFPRQRAYERTLASWSCQGNQGGYLALSAAQYVPDRQPTTTGKLR